MNKNTYYILIMIVPKIFGTKITDISANKIYFIMIQAMFCET